MKNEHTAALIDLVVRQLLDDPETRAELEDDAEVFAIALVGELQSKWMVIPLPDVSVVDEAATRAEVDAILPGLFGHQGKATT